MQIDAPVFRLNIVTLAPGMVVNMIMSSASLRTGESWTPVCLSQYNDKVHSHSASDICIYIYILLHIRQKQKMLLVWHGERSPVCPGFCLCLHFLHRRLAITHSDAIGAELS